MTLDELIQHLQKAKQNVGGHTPVYLHYDGEEIEAFGVSVRIIDHDEFELIIE